MVIEVTSSNEKEPLSLCSMAKRISEATDCVT